MSDIPPNRNAGGGASFHWEATPSSDDDEVEEVDTRAVAGVAQPVTGALVLNPVSLDTAVSSSAARKGSTRPPKQPGKPSTSKVTKAKKPRGDNFSEEELYSFLDDVREVLPMGTIDWEIIARRHHVAWPETDRSAMSLKNKFAKLTSQRAQTGEYELSPEVAEAFEINNMIRDKACLTTAHLPTTGIPHESAEGTENQEEGETNVDRRAAVLSNIASAPAASLSAAVYSSSRKKDTTTMRSKRTAAAATEPFDFQQVMAQQMIRQEARELEREKERREDKLRREDNNRRLDDDNRRRDDDNRRRDAENRSNMQQLMMFMSGGANHAQPPLSTIDHAGVVHQLEPARHTSDQQEDISASVTSKKTPPKRRRSPRTSPRKKQY